MLRRSWIFPHCNWWIRDDPCADLRTTEATKIQIHPGPTSPLETELCWKSWVITCSVAQRKLSSCLRVLKLICAVGAFWHARGIKSKPRSNVQRQHVFCEGGAQAYKHSCVTKIYANFGWALEKTKTPQQRKFSKAQNILRDTQVHTPILQTERNMFYGENQTFIHAHNFQHFSTFFGVLFFGGFWISWVKCLQVGFSSCQYIRIHIPVADREFRTKAFNRAASK